MFKKIARDILIVFGLAALSASTSRTFMQFISTHRDGDKWWCTYPCLNGDLVSLSYLDIVRKFNPGRQDHSLKRAEYSGDKNTILVLHGDSYTRKLEDSAFAGVSDYVYISRINGGYYHIDKSKRNILLIEVAERYIRSYFGGLQMLNEVHDTGLAKKTSAYRYPVQRTGETYASILPYIQLDAFFNKYINQNLQCNLFNYNFMMPMFESKAALNYYLFNRASGDVVISDDRNYLFLKETVSKTGSESSYSPISNDELKGIIWNLNTIYDHFRAAGFNEVYFSIIPNSATIVQPNEYNNLIPMIQNDPGLKMKIVDIYNAFKNSKEDYYSHGDTHWNNKGRQLWIDLVNSKLRDK